MTDRTAWQFKPAKFLDDFFFGLAAGAGAWIVWHLFGWLAGLGT